MNYAEQAQLLLENYGKCVLTIDCGECVVDFMQDHNITICATKLAKAAAEAYLENLHKGTPPSAGRCDDIWGNDDS